MTSVNGRVPSISDVAAHAGVSLGTVSNVLNYPEKVSESTLAKVVAAIEQLGFVRNNNARALAVGSSRFIGLSVPDIANMLFVDVARGAQNAARDAGMSFMLSNSDTSAEQQDENLAIFDEVRVAGILLAPMQDSHASVERVRRHGRPVVILNYVTGSDDACHVLVDNEKVGYLAARHLIDLGRTHLAFVGGRDDLQPVHFRRMGARRAVAEEGGRVTLDEIHTEDLNQPGGNEAALMLASLPAEQRPDGLIAVTDLIGVAITQVFNERGISVPEDVAVMGCDFNSAAWGGAIPLTSVTMRGYDMGLEATRLLIEEITLPPEEHVHVTVTLEPSVVVRESTVGRAPSGR
ncbi:LacI family DNA-binding transcriptional regulator [Leifsonia poae]|uniref:LacI family DNA-binding transcriptional regulator n=1 Tax=Leifsonia poae TaxID=110933 RepID=UPI003D67A0AA